MNLITIPYIYIAAILTVIWAVYRFISLRKNKEKNILREVAINLFYMYFLIVIKFKICPMGWIEINFRNSFYINYIPFVGTVNMINQNHMGIGNTLFNILGNIFILVPLGFFIPLLFQEKNKFVKVTLYGMFTSLVIELIQLFNFSSVTDIDDVIFNTLGAMLGYLIFNLFYHIVKNTKLKGVIENVSSKFQGNLLLLIVKPLGVMFIAVLGLAFIMIFNSSVSYKASNEEIAETVFKNSVNAGFQAVKDTSKYKLFLKDEGDYVELAYLKKIIGSRWLDSRTIIGQYGNGHGDYKIGLIHDGREPLTIVVFGKNKAAAKVEFIVNGKTCSEDIKEGDYFISAFSINENVKGDDLDYLLNDNVSAKLFVRFLDSAGNEYTDMKFAK